MVQKILIGIIILLALVSAGLFYKLTKEQKLVLSQQIMIERLNVSNNELKTSIHSQNSKIDTLKSSSDKFKKYMEDLNIELDNIILEYEYINKNVVSSEDAIEWLRKQALQF